MRNCKHVIRPCWRFEIHKPSACRALFRNVAIRLTHNACISLTLSSPHHGNFSFRIKPIVSLGLSPNSLALTLPQPFCPLHLDEIIPYARALHAYSICGPVNNDGYMIAKSG